MMSKNGIFLGAGIFTMATAYLAYFLFNSETNEPVEIAKPFPGKPFPVKPFPVKPFPVKPFPVNSFPEMIKQKFYTNTHKKSLQSYIKPGHFEWTLKLKDVEASLDFDFNVDDLPQSFETLD